MAPRVRDYLPDEMREMPLQTQVAVLYERVGTLQNEVRGLRRALWSFVFSIAGGAILFLFSVASGWFGPNSGHGATKALIHAIGGVFS